GETSVNYTIVPADAGRAVQCVVLASNSTGAVAAASNAIAVPACVVPRVRGVSEATAKSRLKRSGCAVGRTRKTHSHRVPGGRVVKAKPRPGKTRASGSRVDLYVAS